MQLEDRLTHREANPDNEGETLEIKFNAHLTTEGTMADLFRVFTTGPAYNKVYIPDLDEDNPLLMIAYIGGKSKPVREGCMISAGVSFEGWNQLNASEMWLGNVNEPKGGSVLLAILIASLKTRSEEIITYLTSSLSDGEDSGFINSNNSGLLRTVIGRLRMCASPTYFVDLADTQESVNEIEVRSLAKNALRNERPMVLSPIPTELHLTGVKLAKMTQAILYKTIMRSKDVPIRPRTGKVTKEIVSCMKRLNRKPPSTKQIWTSLQSKEFARPLKIFLWKCAHDAYKVGLY